MGGAGTTIYFRDMVDWILIGLQGFKQETRGDGPVLLDLRLPARLYVDSLPLRGQTPPFRPCPGGVRAHFGILLR